MSQQHLPPVAARKKSTVNSEFPGPQATSTPNSDVLTYGTSQASTEWQLSLRDLLNILDPSLALGTQEFTTSQDKHWTGRSLSVRACYEILYGIITEKIPHQLEASLLEILCFYLENTFRSNDTERIDDNKLVFRAFIPALLMLLTQPKYGPWIAKLLAILFGSQGIVPDPVIHYLLYVLANVPHSPITTHVRAAVLALLRRLQPLRPDLVTDTLFKENFGSFPEYSPEYRDRLEDGTEEDMPFATLLQPKAYSVWHRTPLHVSKKMKWFTGDALADRGNFSEFWWKIRFPDHPTALLGDPQLLHAYWLAKKPSSDAVTLEKRILNAMDDLFSRNKGKDHEISRMLQLSQHISDHIHEIQPSIASTAAELVKDLKSPLDVFLRALANLSIVYLAGNDIGIFDQVLESAMVRCQMEDAKAQLRILDAMYKLLQDFYRDLPRISFLNDSDSEAQKMERARTQFVHSETTIQACFVDDRACLGVFMDYFDAMLWEPLLIEPCNSPYNTAMWAQAIDIWKLLASIDRQGKPYAKDYPVLVPHPAFCRFGLLHHSSLISDEIESLMYRYVDLDEKRGTRTERVEVVRIILKELF